MNLTSYAVSQGGSTHAAWWWAPWGLLRLFLFLTAPQRLLIAFTFIQPSDHCFSTWWQHWHWLMMRKSERGLKSRWGWLDNSLPFESIILYCMNALSLTHTKLIRTQTTSSNCFEYQFGPCLSDYLTVTFRLELCQWNNFFPLPLLFGGLCHQDDVTCLPGPY